MQRKRLGWILLPTAVIAIAVVTLVVSSYQREAHIAVPGKGGVAATAAAADAWRLASGDGAAGYDAFSKTLMFAIVEARNMPLTNPAETRLQTALTNTLDCLAASREAWQQAELDHSWDPTIEGSPGYWTTLHPALTSPPVSASLAPEQVRSWSRKAADYWLQKALYLTTG